MSDHQHSSYLEEVFLNTDSFARAVGRAVDTINMLKNYVDVDYIAVRGVSGMTVGSVVAYELNLPLIVVRKKVDSHAMYTVEGNPKNTGFHYVIVDDMVSSGNTVNTIVKEIANDNPSSILVGIVQYKVHWARFIMPSNVVHHPNLQECILNDLDLIDNIHQNPYFRATNYND